MESPISEKEIEFCELFHDPTALAENLMPIKENAPQTWSEKCKCVTIRPYQFGMQNYSYLILDDPMLSEQENTQKKKGSGDAYHIGSRNTGKSFFLKIDVLLQYIHKCTQCCVASFDARHLKNIATPIALYIEAHPFLQIFHLKDSRSKTVKRDPLNVVSEHGSIIKGVNEQTEGSEPGVQFHSLHFDILFYEEASYMSEEGTKKRIDSGKSTGYIERFSGIPDLRIGSPLTNVLSNQDLKRKIWRCPQYIREDWTTQTRKQMEEKYAGASSNAYKLNVEAEILEGASGFWDMQRLKRKSLKHDRKVKYFEISKDTYHNFESRLIVERLPGAEQVYICADIGLGNRPTEIVIIFKVNGKYKYTYQISLFKLIQKEQAQIFKWLYDKLGGGYIAHDATGDGGATIDELFELGIPQEHLLKVKLNSNLEVDFLKDEKGFITRNNQGDPLMKKVNAMEFAMQQLEELLYNGKLEIAYDDKFLREFNGYWVKQIGINKKKYGSTTTDDLHQAFQIFSVCRYFNDDNPMENKLNQKRCYGVF